MNIENIIWIGLTQVACNKENDLLKGAQNAYVNVLGVARNKSDFIEKIKTALHDLNLDFINIEELEPFSVRIKNYEVDEAILKLAREVNETKELRFSNFHTFNDG